MSLKGKAYIAGACERPTVARLHADCARGALDDPGLSNAGGGRA